MAGEQASQITIDSLPKLLRAIFPTTPKTTSSSNISVKREGNQPHDHRAWGTRFLAPKLGHDAGDAYIRGRRIYIAALVTALLIPVRNGEMKMLTTDHNLAQVLVETGTISKENHATTNTSIGSTSFIFSIKRS